MKPLKIAFAVSLLMLGCSQGLKHSNRSNGFNVTSKDAAQFDGTRVKDQDSRAPIRRLESITWDSVKHELKWDVSRGEKRSGGYEPHSSDRYEINMDKATMTFNGESRRFSEEEAGNVRVLLEFVSKYAVESTVWWENGEGEPVDGNGKPLKPGKPHPDTNREDKARAVQVVATYVSP